MGKWSSASWLFLVRNIQRTKDSLFSYLIFADEKKTIKPASAGGQGNPIEILFHARLLKIFNTIIAGGQKYIVQGIFFKFALGMFLRSLARQQLLSCILFPSPPTILFDILSPTTKICMGFMEEMNLPCNIHTLPSLTRWLPDSFSSFCFIAGKQHHMIWKVFLDISALEFQPFEFLSW